MANNVFQSHRVVLVARRCFVVVLDLVKRIVCRVLELVGSHLADQCLTLQFLALPENLVAHCRGST